MHIFTIHFPKKTSQQLFLYLHTFIRKSNISYFLIRYRKCYGIRNNTFFGIFCVRTKWMIPTLSLVFRKDIIFNEKHCSLQFCFSIYFPTIFSCLVLLGICIAEQEMALDTCQLRPLLKWIRC